MAKLKSLKLKSKEFVFTAFDNDKDEKPAKIVFKRFPIIGEMFTPIDKKNIFEDIDIGDLSKPELKSKIADNLIKGFMDNITAGRIDYKQFFSECVDSFKDFEFGDSKVLTPDSFWQILPQDAAIAIAQEAYEYANERDEFTMGNSNA